MIELRDRLFFQTVYFHRKGRIFSNFKERIFNGKGHIFRGMTVNFSFQTVYVLLVPYTLRLSWIELWQYVIYMVLHRLGRHIKRIRVRQ